MKSQVMVYLDSCILISYFSKSKKEQEKKKTVGRLVQQLKKLSAVEICISPWTITEMVNILIKDHGMTNEEVWQIETSLVNKRRFCDLKIRILDPQDDSKKGYDFKEFFHDIRETNLKYHPGLADSIHIVIMKNNDINFVITFNVKDFEEVEGLKVVDIDNFLEQNIKKI
jgi:predicted nucleic acid-binding protein